MGHLGSPFSMGTLSFRHALFFFIALVFLGSVLFISSRQSLQTGSRANDEASMAEVKSALSTKPLSTICSEHKAQAISAFDTCKAGSVRLSPNKENPLFYCCLTP